MTSLARIKGPEIIMSEAKEYILTHLKEVFGLNDDRYDHSTAALA